MLRKYRRGLAWLQVVVIILQTCAPLLAGCRFYEDGCEGEGIDFPTLIPKTLKHNTPAGHHTGYAQVVEEKDSSGALRKRYHYGHDLIAIDHTSDLLLTNRFYYSYDGHGSVRAITNEQGAALEEYDYDAFGVLLSVRQVSQTSGLLEELLPSNFYLSTFNTYLYTGEQFDKDLGQYYLRARYLNPQSGRFHSMDTYEGRNGEPLTLHKYLYAHANPVSYVDPSGNMILEQVATQAVLGTLLSIDLRRVSIIGTAIVNTAIQARMYMMLRPIAGEIDLLANEVNSVDSVAASKLRAVSSEIKSTISSKMIAGNIIVPTLAITVPKFGPYLGLGITGYRLYAVNKLASDIVERTASGVTFDDGKIAFSFSGDVHPRVNGAMIFIGVYEPAQDISRLRDTIKSIKQLDPVSAQNNLDKFLNGLKKYKSNGSGSAKIVPARWGVNFMLEEGVVSYSGFYE